MGNMKQQKILKDKDLPDKDEREYYYDQFLNQLNEDMRKQKELKEYNAPITSLSNYILKTEESIPKNQLITSYDDNINDIIKEKYNKDVIPQKEIKHKKTNSYDKLVNDIAKDTIIQKKLKDEQKELEKEEYNDEDEDDAHEQQTEEIIKDTIKGQHSDQTPYEKLIEVLKKSKILEKELSGKKLDRNIAPEASADNKKNEKQNDDINKVPSIITSEEIIMEKIPSKPKKKSKKKKLNLMMIYMKIIMVKILMSKKMNLKIKI